MKHALIILITGVTLAGCAQTSIQQLSKSRFQVATTTAPICGRSGATKITSKVAAIEVIKRGGDMFIIDTARTSSEYSGGLMPRAQQGITVEMVDRDHAAYKDALSAREVLGDKWEKQVKKGKPSTC